jgi:long-chain acyl-CoA synthetase
MDFKKIEERILSFSPYIEEIQVFLKDGALSAIVKPKIQALKDAKIVNIEEEIRWYAIELYNLKVPSEQKIAFYEIVYDESENNAKDEPNDEIYKLLKSYLSTLTQFDIKPCSHIELNLGLDSIQYVELFLFIENGFGVFIDEKIFSQIMTVWDLYAYIKKRATRIEFRKKEFKEFLIEPLNKKLVYSPFIMSVYKILLFPLFKCYFRLENSGERYLPKTPCIIAPSHQSMLDGFLILATLPYGVLKKSFFLAYKNVFGKGILKPIAIHGQNILIDANENLKETMQYTALPLKEKKNLVIFPEGARSRDRKLLEFRPFFAILSKTFNVPVIPVVIDGSFEALQSGKIFPRPKKIKVTYLKPIYPQGRTVQEIRNETKEAIAKEMREKPVLI